MFSCDLNTFDSAVAVNSTENFLDPKPIEMVEKNEAANIATNSTAVDGHRSQFGSLQEVTKSGASGSIMRDSRMSSASGSCTLVRPFRHTTEDGASISKMCVARRNSASGQVQMIENDRSTAKECRTAFSPPKIDSSQSATACTSNTTASDSRAQLVEHIYTKANFGGHNKPSIVSEYLPYQLEVLKLKLYSSQS